MTYLRRKIRSYGVSYLSGSLSNQERRKLVRHGKQPGARIKDLISIVSYSTFRKWVRQLEDGAPFCVVSERHLDPILRRAADWYNHCCCHSARGNLPPLRECADPPVVDLKKQGSFATASSAGG